MHLLAEIAGYEQLPVVAQLLRVVVRHDLPVRQNVAAICDLESKMNVLLDQQHSAAALLRERPHDREQPFDDHRREPEAQLVQQQQPGVARKSARDREHLLQDRGVIKGESGFRHPQAAIPDITDQRLRHTCLRGAFAAACRARREVALGG